MTRRGIAIAVLLATLPASGTANALSVASSVPVGAEPAHVALNPVTKRIYVAATGWKSGPGPGPGNEVTVLDGTTSPPTFVASIPTGVYPYGIDVNPVTNKVYVGNAGGSVTVIDEKSSPATVKTIPGITGAAGVAVHPILNRVYVMTTIGTLVVIDGFTDTVMAALPIVPPGHLAFLVAVDPVLNRVLVPEWKGGLVHVVNALTNTPSAFFPVPPIMTGELGDIAVHPLTHDIYLTDEKGGLYLIDGVHFTVNATAPVGIPGSLPFGTWGVEVDGLRQRVFVVQFHTNSVHLFDAFSLAHLGVVHTGPLGTGPTSGPHFSAIDPVTGHVYVTNELASSLSVVTEP